ncbi:hypothetical protein B5E48_02050 [Massilimicrobiota sp. An105]|uniref:restriction endonuclease subunit S n=1 Tax=Massilimicrobiota sp. An105 TaxID=1965540 RepID=UPI000B39EF8C|nr:restriction endonuclease subunit S [Massilimicrobiota sp. An105]OUQ83548.1 hypothetical protein B5E48_02050 [Massilimicrobiota sp. An105]
MDFSEIFEDKTKYGTKLKTDEYEEQGKYLIVDQGQELIAGYTDKKEGFFSELPVIIFGDHTRILKYIDQPFYIGADGVKILRCKFQNANYKYLFYALKNVYIPNTGYNRHFKWLKQSSIKYPDSVTQNRIVKILDTVSSIIELQKKELDQLECLIKARFVEMFGDPIKNDKGWKQVKLMDLGLLARGISKHRPRNAVELLGGPYPLVQTGEVANADTYITSYLSTYSELGLKQSKMWPKGTLCITIAANIAQTSILTFDACFPDSVVGFIAGERVETVFVHYWFSFLQSSLEALATQVAQKNLNLKTLSNVEVIVPPIQLQSEFVNFTKQVDKSKFINKG